MQGRMEGNLGNSVASPGSVLELGGMRLRFGNFTTIPAFGSIEAEGGYYPEAAGMGIPVTVERGGSSMGAS